MRRFRVTGERADGGWGEDATQADVRYVDAPDPDAAARRAGWLFSRTSEVREVPWDEGRGLLWRLWRRLFGG